MRIDWKKFPYEIFAKSMPELTRLYFGLDLMPERIEGNRTIFFHEGKRLLSVIHLPTRVRYEEVHRIAKYLTETRASAGLVVTSSPQTFSFRLFRQPRGGWFPVAVWGRNQVDAIASLNNERLIEIVPFKRRIAHHTDPDFRDLGSGGVLWSDIAEFVSLGHSIGEKISVSPNDVKKHLIASIDKCFERATQETPTYTGKIGADGWFYFFRQPLGFATVKLAINCMTRVREIAMIDPWYEGHEFKLVTGINEASNVLVDRQGQPFDDDSIITYRLLRERYRLYDVRATGNAVSNLVEIPHQQEWSPCGSFAYDDGRKVDVLGHRLSSIKMWSAGTIPFNRREGKLQYLVIRKRSGGSWDFPIGKRMEADASPRETAIREAREETGIDVRLTEGFEYLSHYSTRYGANHSDTVFMFLGECQSKLTSSSTEETDSSVWLYLDDALRRLTFPNSKDALLKAHVFLIT